jgi:ADP-heptose:LPS heptosyltransferase
MHFVSLQYGDCMQEIKQLKKEKNVHIHSWNDADPLSDLDNFSAQISALDLVISVDNSTVHFAGAVGTTVYVLLPLLSNYRWMQYRDDSPWYPTMKLFRQVSHNNWNNVFYDIEKELKNKINST